MLARHMLGTLLTSDKSTVTNLICTHGGQNRDWTADYRLYSRDRVEESHLFDQAREPLLENLAPGEALVVALDDTIVRKTGKKIHGSGWKRDPLGPAFQTNLVQAQRYLQFSAAWPLRDASGAPTGEARMIPIDFLHAPSPVKPKKGTVDPVATAAYREALKQHNLNAQTLSRLQALREKVPVDRRIVLTGDGSFTNKTILRGLPAGCVYIGRARKDTVLHHLPETPKIPVTGRPCRYGSSAPTPEALRTDDTLPWQTVRAFAAGGHHQFRIKTLGPLLWRKSGADLPLRLLVIAPLGYRLRQGSRLLYRQPAYLLCTDPDLSLEEFLQSYLWRWGIEVNFREEKTLIGTGDAHIRTHIRTHILQPAPARSHRRRLRPAVGCRAVSPREEPTTRLPASAEVAQGPPRNRPPSRHRRPAPLVARGNLGPRAQSGEFRPLRDRSAPGRERPETRTRPISHPFRRRIIENRPATPPT